MLQKNILPKFNNQMEAEVNNLFHSSGLPLHFNKTGNKEFTNYQRISIIVLFYKSGKSIRDFIDDIKDSKWISWLGLKKIPKKSTLHDWLSIFSMKIIRNIFSLLIPKKIELTAIDGTGFDAWQRSRHYEKRAGEIQELPHMPYAKAGLFIDVKTQIILDFDFVMSHKHDVKIAEKIFKRNKIKNIRGIGDKGYDSENLHEIARANGINFFAPVRDMDKRAFKNQRPSGFYRRKCLEVPEYYNMRNIVETVNSVLKRTQIHYLRSKNHFMREREFAWNVVVYNIKRKIKISSRKVSQTFFIQVYLFVLSGQSRYIQHLISISISFKHLRKAHSKNKQYHKNKTSSNKKPHEPKIKPSRQKRPLAYPLVHLHLANLPC